MKLQLNQIILIGCFLAIFSAPIHAQLPTIGSASVTLHYDAASLNGSHNHGDPVQTWPATVGPDAMAEVAGRQPTFNSNWSPAGLPGVTFDGENDVALADRLVIGAGGDTGVEAQALFAVLQLNDTGFPEQQFIFGGDNAKVMGVRAGQLFVVDQPAGTSFSDTTSMHVVSWVSGSPIHIDGQSPGGDTIRTTTFSNLSLIGDERRTPPDNPGPNMTFGELVAYSGGVMTPEDRTTIEQFLINKYAVSAPDPFDSIWDQNDAGLWIASTNWTTSGAPTTQNHRATFGDAISAPTSVIVDTPVTVNQVNFDHDVSYVIAGAGSVNLQSSTAAGNSNPTLNVVQGNHQFQAIANLLNDTTATVASDSTLSFNNALNLMGNTLTKSGTGTLEINNLLTTVGGAIDLEEGTIAGHGMVGGDVNNGGGTVSPGNSVSNGQAVPEPMCALLVMVGIVLLGGLRPKWYVAER